MSLMLAFKAFIKAFKDPAAAEKFINPEPSLAISHKAKEDSFLRLLFLLQKSGRLMDFFKEDISKFNDAQVGAAARKIHQECRECIEEYVTVRPIFEQDEGKPVVLPVGYNTEEIKVIGKVKGSPPYQGILRHKGWKAHKLTLPKVESKSDVIYQAEVEIKES